MIKEDDMAYEVSSHTSTLKPHASQHLSVTRYNCSHTIIQSYSHTNFNMSNMNTNILTKYYDVITTH
jgi:hypothetical protein